MDNYSGVSISFGTDGFLVTGSANQRSSNTSSSGSASRGKRHADDV